jgi:hypothetical protein
MGTPLKRSTNDACGNRQLAEFFWRRALRRPQKCKRSALALSLVTLSHARADYIQLMPNSEGKAFGRFAFVYQDVPYVIYGNQLARVDDDKWPKNE